MTIAASEIAAVDPWYEWLIARRFGGDSAEAQRIRRNWDVLAGRILRAARLRPTDVVLDLGCGGGLLGIAALTQGGVARAVFVDPSPELLSHAEAAARALGFSPRCSFINACADEIPVAVGEPVDAVLCRSVLIHIRHKREIFQAVHDLLRPGGRLSLFEPLNRWTYAEAPNRFWGYDVSEVAAIAAKLKALYDRCIAPDLDPMVDFDEHDLRRLIEDAGFRRLRMRVEWKSDTLTRPRVWKTFAEMQWNPRSPSLAEAMESELSPAERIQLIAHLQPLVERGDGKTRWSAVYAAAERAAS